MTTTRSSTDGSTKANRSESGKTESGKPRQPAASAPPSKELLEFLGEFSDERGEWIDPLELDDPDPVPDAGKGGGHD
jgi:hypothetical protein